MSVKRYLLRRRKRKLPRKKALIIAVVLLLVILPGLSISFYLLLFSKGIPGPGQFNRETGLVHLQRLHNGKLNLAPVLKLLEGQEADKRLLSAWLKHQGYYRVDDPGLVKALTALCPVIFQDDLAGYQQDLAGCGHLPVISALRALARDKLPPFQPLAHKVRIGVPARKHQPRDGEANSCFSGLYENKNILLFTDNENEALVLRVKGAYVCDTVNRYPDLQLNEAQVSRLFNRKARHSEYLMVLENLSGELKP